MNKIVAYSIIVLCIAAMIPIAEKCNPDNTKDKHTTTVNNGRLDTLLQKERILDSLLVELPADNYVVQHDTFIRKVINTVYQTKEVTMIDTTVINDTVKVLVDVPIALEQVIDTAITPNGKVIATITTLGQLAEVHYEIEPIKVFVKEPCVEPKKCGFFKRIFKKCNN